MGRLLEQDGSEALWGDVFDDADDAKADCWKACLAGGAAPKPAPSSRRLAAMIRPLLLPSASGRPFLRSLA